MTKHTPGPWSFSRGTIKDSNFADHVAIVQGDGCNLARVRGGVRDGAKTAIANARLISAAPELADLARNVAGFYDRLLLSADLRVLRATLNEYREQARSALVKVED